MDPTTCKIKSVRLTGGQLAAMNASGAVHEGAENMNSSDDAFRLRGEPSQSNTSPLTNNDASASELGQPEAPP